MKTLRLIGMAIFAIVMSVNFAACDDDDDECDLCQLEGTWGLVSEEGYEYYNGKKESWKEKYDPFNPNEDSGKITIKNISDNTYSGIDYEYYNNEWHANEPENFQLDGYNIILEHTEPYTEYTRIVTVNAKQLVFEIGGKDTEGDFYEKISYVRM